MKKSSLVIADARLLGNTGNVIMRFVGQPTDSIAIKPLSVLIARLEPMEKQLVALSPSLLNGAVITVEDSDYNGTKVKGLIDVFKKGDSYKVQSFNSLVTEGVINPATNVPYVEGDDAVTTADGITIQGNINVKLNIKQLNPLQAIAAGVVVNNVMANTVATASAGSRSVNEPHEEPIVEENPLIDEAHVEPTEETKTA